MVRVKPIHPSLFIPSPLTGLSSSQCTVKQLYLQLDGRQIYLVKIVIIGASMELTVVNVTTNLVLNRDTLPLSPLSGCGNLQ